MLPKRRKKPKKRGALQQVGTGFVCILYYYFPAWSRSSPNMYYPLIIFNPLYPGITEQAEEAKAERAREKAAAASAATSGDLSFDNYNINTLI
jgi:hypothetical protein